MGRSWRLHCTIRVRKGHRDRRGLRARRGHREIKDRKGRKDCPAHRGLMALRDRRDRQAVRGRDSRSSLHSMPQLFTPHMTWSRSTGRAMWRKR